MIIESYHPVSHRFAIVDGSELAVWLYITATDSTEPVNDAFLYCSTFLDSFAEAGEMILRGETPSITPDLATPYSQRTDVQDSDVAITWSADGEAVAVFIAGEVVAFSVASEPKGYSKSLAKVSDWGMPWDQTIFDALFGSEI